MTLETSAATDLTTANARHVAQLQLLNQVSTRLHALIDSEHFYQDLVDLIYRKFHFYSIHIWTFTPEEQAITLRAQEGAYQGHLPMGFTLPLENAGITGQVVRTRQAYLCSDVSRDPAFTNLSLPVASQSELCVPILSDHEVLGTLNVESDTPHAFFEDDQITLEAIASQIAVAIDNRRLLRETQDFNTTLQSKVDEKTTELQAAHKRILEQQKLLERENTALKTQIKKENSDSEIVGQSPSLHELLSMVDKIAPTQITVLIQGESGTGKELIAKRLHEKSPRAQAPFVILNCGALQEALLESELFGHERGAFTGAVAQKMGLAETADGGTLFLDEIGEMSLSIQAKLLRFLQEGEFYRIGGKRPIKVNVRVISATNRELDKEVEEGRFREDLFYRLNTITLRMPPLRKRKEDLPALVAYFLKHSRFGNETPIRKIDPRVLEVFQAYDWPGNIRELQNTVERLRILAENGEIRLEDLPPSLRMPRGLTTSSKFNGEHRFSMKLEEIERDHILRSLAYHQGNKTKTAQTLGITIKTLYNKLHRYGALDTKGATHG